MFHTIWEASRKAKQCCFFFYYSTFCRFFSLFMPVLLFLENIFEHLYVGSKRPCVFPFQTQSTNMANLVPKFASFGYVQSILVVAINLQAQFHVPEHRSFVTINVKTSQLFNWNFSNAPSPTWRHCLTFAFAFSSSTIKGFTYEHTSNSLNFVITLINLP